MTRPDDRALVTEPIPALMRTLTIPVSVGLFFNTMYNVTDTWFAGFISTRALAAMSLSMPVFFLIVSVGSGLSTGSAALIGNALGAGDRDTASEYALQSLTFGGIAALMLTPAGLLISPFLFRILGASDAYLDICMAYMSVLFSGTAFFFLVYMLKGILNALGDTRTYRNFLIIGFLLNIGLDPWFIFGGFGIPPMGVKGVALATVIVQGIGCLYLGFEVYKTGLLSGKTVSDALPRKKPQMEIARQGFPAGLNIMTIALGVFIITYFVGKFGEEAVAAYGIGTRVEQIFLLPVIGLNTATLTLVAQNHGAGRPERIRETLITAFRYGGTLMLGGALFVLFFARRFMAFFSDDPAVIAIGVSYLLVDALTLYAYVILFVCVAALQGIKRPMFALYIGLYRQIIAPFLIFYLLTAVWDFGVSGIWWGIFGVTWSAALITGWHTQRVFSIKTDSRSPNRLPEK